MTSRIIRPEALGYVRLADVEDVPKIMKLINESVAVTFRISHERDLVYLIETAVLSICQLTVNDQIVGFLSAKDHPLIPSVHPGAWEEYMWTKYKTVDMNSRNTLFLHMLCWNPIYARELVDNLMKTIFMHDQYLQYIAMVKINRKHLLCVPGQLRSEASFKRVQAMERGTPGDLMPLLFVADRSDVCPRLRIRKAVEEDNDDIVPIIEKHSPRLREIYGDFYISELISRHPESERTLLVCEHKELAVGVMCLNTQINFETLEENFELSPYGGLRHITCKQVALYTADVYYMDSRIGSLKTPSLSLTSGVKMNKFMDHITREYSNILWQQDEETLHESLHTQVQKEPLFSSAFDLLNQLFDEEEELDFDIVNIDTELLRVPQFLSYDYIEGSGIGGCLSKHIDKNYKVNMTNENHRREKQSREKPSREKPKKDKVHPTTAVPQPDPIRYVGAPNAFLLELFAIQEQYDERCGFDMLEVAFEIFPDREYCILCLPSNHAPFPLLEHFTLVTPIGCRERYITDTLYVAHVNSVTGKVKVRPGEEYDGVACLDILEHAQRKDAIMELFYQSLLSSCIHSYILLSQNQPIGLIILGPLEAGVSIRTHYNLDPDPKRHGTDAALLAGIMSPVLEPHSRWFMRDVMRQSQYNELFWMCRTVTKGDMNAAGRNLISFASRMTPVSPRRHIPNITENRHLDKIHKDIASPWSLWTIDRPLTSLPKVLVNNSIVVVGASRTGLAFLETMLIGPAAKYLTFTNITLVSDHGVGCVPECLRAADICVPHDGRYTDRYLKSLPLYYYVDVMKAVMKTINRKNKYISLKGGGKKYYDQLVLTCGQQFQHPGYMQDLLEHVKEIERGKPCERMLMDDPRYNPERMPSPPELPDNVMLVNSVREANANLCKLMHMITEAKDNPFGLLSPDNPVVVYGDCLEAYTCMAALLELGLKPEMILFVEPFPPEDQMRVNCWNNETVDERVQASLRNLPIKVLRKCYFDGWWKREDGTVASLRLMFPLHIMMQPCFALFYYGLKAIDLYAFNAINECGLVYDGGLVVGTMFETNDPNIFAAGPCTKYSRALYANKHCHRYYRSEDVGQELAKKFLRNMDVFITGNPRYDKNPVNMPTFSSTAHLGSYNRMSGSSISLSNKPMKLKWKPVIRFESPIFQYAVLPGNLYYLKFRAPGRETPMEVQSYLPRQGHTFITDNDGVYFRLQLNILHCITAVTCLSKKVIYPEVLIQLYGKHEAFFNKMLTRYEMNAIPDLLDFFMQPWMALLYQDTFDELMVDINQHDLGTVNDLVKRNALQEESELDRCAPSSCFEALEAMKLHSFRSVIQKYMTKTKSFEQFMSSKAKDVPSECGQNIKEHEEARGFWNAVDGENILMDYLSRFLLKHDIVNAQYAHPKAPKETDEQIKG